MPSPQYWKTNVRPIVDGDNVNASVANRAIQDQSSREEYLFGQINSLNLSSGRLIRANVAMRGDTILHDVVYYDTASATWAPALAEYIEKDGEPVPTERSFAAGLVLSLSGGFGDVLLFGQILTEGQPGEYTVDSLDLLDVQDSSFVSGTYYLSRKQAGKISRVPSAPTVSLGYFSDGSIVFTPTHKSFQESHFHYAFDLTTRPSASQNYDESGWNAFGGSTKFVDYFNRNTDTTPPVIVATIRWTGAEDPDPVRIDLYRSGVGTFSANLISGVSLDYNNPQSLGPDTVPVIVDQAWPAYGEYVAIGSTGLEVAFLDSTGVSANTLTVDANALLVINTDKFKFFLPNDLHGWTNANPLDINTPANVLYRYVTEGQKLLDLAFPPLPMSSAVLESNGISLVSLDDFLINLTGIWWYPTAQYAPWPSDFTVDGAGMDDANARNLKIHFSKATTANVNAGVHSLKTTTPALVITRCPGGEAGEDGALNIDLNLGLQVDTEITEGQDLALVGASGETLLRGPVVTELTAGAGILLERLSTSLIPNSSRLTGKVRISRRDVNLEGEVSSIALRNAKEIKGDFFPYVSFPPPSRAPSAISACFKLPITGIAIGTLMVSTQALGSISAPLDRRGIFKAIYHAVRPGFNLGDLSEANAFSVQYWTVLFASGYVAMDILDSEIAGSGITATTITTDFPSALIDNLADGDLISVTISRVTEDLASIDDDYTGDIGFAGIRWALT